MKKIIGSDTVNSKAQGAANAGQGVAGVESLLRRVFMYLEDGNWSSANEYCERVLDIEPENAEAYLGKLMAETQCRKRDELVNLKEPFDQNINFKKIARFGNAQLIQELQVYISKINARNQEEEERRRQQELADRYSEAVQQMNEAAFERDFMDAAKAFDGLKGYYDSDERAAECRRQAGFARVYEEAKARYNENTEESVKKAIDLFTSISYWGDASEKAEQCRSLLANMTEKRIKKREVKYGKF